MFDVRRITRILRTRPLLWSSVALGVLVYAVPPRWMVPQVETRVLLAWNATSVLYLVLAWAAVRGTDRVGMRRRAEAQNEGRIFVLTMVVASAAAVLMAIGSQLSSVRELHGVARTAHIALAAFTVMTSWLFTQTLFALHYAHDFYTLRASRQPDPLLFPGTPDPGYGDFFYFSCTIGTSAQAADVAFTGSAMRSVGTLHCILAYFFNTIVLALTMNIAAGLF